MRVALSFLQISAIITSQVKQEKTLDEQRLKFDESTQQSMSVHESFSPNKSKSLNSHPHLARAF